MAIQSPKLVTSSKLQDASHGIDLRNQSVTDSADIPPKHVASSRNQSQIIGPSHAVFAEAIDAESINESDLSPSDSLADTVSLLRDDSSYTEPDRHFYRSDAKAELRELREDHEQLRQDYFVLLDKHSRLKQNTEFFPIHDPKMPLPQTMEYKNMRQQLIETRAEMAELKSHNEDLLYDSMKTDAAKIDAQDEAARATDEIALLSLSNKKLLDQYNQLLVTHQDLGDHLKNDLYPKLEERDAQIAELESQLKTNGVRSQMRHLANERLIKALQEQIDMFTAADKAHTDKIDVMLSHLKDPVAAASTLFERMNRQQLIATQSLLYDHRMKRVSQPSANTSISQEIDDMMSSLTQSVTTEQPASIGAPMTDRSASSDGETVISRYLNSMAAGRASSKTGTLPKSQAHHRERLKAAVKDEQGAQEAEDSGLDSAGRYKMDDDMNFF